jgi:archaemetzincin
LFKKILIISIVLHLVSCSISENKRNNSSVVTIDILPFSDISKIVVDSVYNSLKNVYPNIKLLKSIQLPKHAYYLPRNRYRADTIIRYLKNITPENHITIGLTSKDISFTKGKIPDYGIMGLGWTPGNSCVVSTYRLSKENKDTQFFKFCLHELGHTSGLQHCSNKMCYMRDAEGGNPTKDETGFCSICKAYLIDKGWNLNSDYSN